MAIEISIPLADAEADELATMCEALGMSVETFLHDNIQQALSGQRIRYANHQARMAAMEKERAGTGIKIVNAATRETVSLGKAKPSTGPAPGTDVKLDG